MTPGEAAVDTTRRFWASMVLASQALSAVPQSRDALLYQQAHLMGMLDLELKKNHRLEKLANAMVMQLGDAVRKLDTPPVKRRRK